MCVACAVEFVGRVNVLDVQCNLDKELKKKYSTFVCALSSVRLVLVHWSFYSYAIYQGSNYLLTDVCFLALKVALIRYPGSVSD